MLTNAGPGAGEEEPSSPPFNLDRILLHARVQMEPLVGEGTRELGG